ncbi:extracellular matrix protein 2 [Stigmatopora argus]
MRTELLLAATLLMLFATAADGGTWRIERRRDGPGAGQRPLGNLGSGRQPVWTKSGTTVLLETCECAGKRGRAACRRRACPDSGREKEGKWRKKAAERESRREERMIRRRRKREEKLRKEQEREEWLTPDVFPEEAAKVEKEEKGEESGGLPPGCRLSYDTLICHHANLARFPPLLLPRLKSLTLEGNDIGAIPAAAFNGIPNLEWINLKGNKLTSGAVHPTAFRILKTLRRLYLDGNLLEALPANLPTSLRELTINENRLRGIGANSLRGMASLVSLELEDNLLSEANVDPEAFQPLLGLCYLRLGRNHFGSIPQGLPASLLELYLENNLIQEIPAGVFNGSRELNVLSLRHNWLEETRMAPLAWIHHRSLESLDLSYNRLHLVPSFLPRSLIHLVLVGNRIERIPGFVLAHLEPGLEYLYLSHNRLDGQAFEAESFWGAYDSMLELCLDHNQLRAVPTGINRMSQLRLLRLDDNRIRDVPEEAFCDPEREEDSALVTVRLDNNPLEAAEVSPATFACVRSSSAAVVLTPRKRDGAPRR